MAQFPINIPDAHLQMVLDGWAKKFGYSATLGGGPSVGGGEPNPETKQQFFLRNLKAEIKRIAQENYTPPDVTVT